MDYSVMTINIPLRMGHYLIVAYTTHLPWVKIFIFDTSIGKDIFYNEKGIPW